MGQIWAPKRALTHRVERENQIEVRLNSKNLKEESWFNYETSIVIKVQRSNHFLGDTHNDCSEYTTGNSYHDCIFKELLNIFDRELGCAPPFLAGSISSMCHKTFNFPKSKDVKLKQIFRSLLYRVREFKCKTPSTKRTYRSTLTHKIPYSGTSLIFSFSPVVAITKSKFSIDTSWPLWFFSGALLAC